MQLGERIGNFELVERLGSGASGEVFAAKHRVLSHWVCIKTLRPHTRRSERQRQRFSLEAEALARICHPNVVRLFDFGTTEDGCPYYITEYHPGHTLEQELCGRAPFALAELAPLIDQLCAGLQEVHDHAIVHRDLKPANVLLCDGPAGARTGDDGAGGVQLKLIDFGLSKAADLDLGLTVEGAGTPLYAAPEQICRATVDSIGPAADIYALGVVAYRCLSGRLPFELPESAGLAEALRLPLHQAPISLGVFRPDLPAECVALIDRCLRVDPSERPASARGFADAYQRAAFGSRTGGAALSSPWGSATVEPEAGSSPVVATQISTRPLTLTSERRPRQLGRMALVMAVVTSAVAAALVFRELPVQPISPRSPAPPREPRASAGRPESPSEQQGGPAPPRREMQRDGFVPLVGEGTPAVARAADTGSTLSEVGREPRPRRAASRVRKLPRKEDDEPAARRAKRVSSPRAVDARGDWIVPVQLGEPDGAGP